jgi:hypothetical protein
MKTLAAFALVLVFGAQAQAQLGGGGAPGNPGRGQQQQAVPTQETQVGLELLELEQEADKTLLKEALLVLGRKGLNVAMERPGDEGASKRELEQQEALKSYIAAKKESIVKRSAEIQALRDEPLRRRRAQAATQVAKVNTELARMDRQGQIEKIEASQAEIQLLQRQGQAYGQKLTEAIEALVNAELMVGKDETQRGMADEARRQYEKAKAKYVEVSKQTRLEENKLNELQQQAGMGGFGGGMGGLGGGFR